MSDQPGIPDSLRAAISVPDLVPSPLGDLQTVPGKAWFAMLRLYGPLAPWFDKTWRPGEIEPLSGAIMDG